MSSSAIMDAIVSKIKRVLSEAEEALASEVTPPPGSLQVPVVQRTLRSASVPALRWMGFGGTTLDQRRQSP